MWAIWRHCKITQFRVKMAAFCQASEVHDFNVLKIFSEADNIPKAIWSKYEYNFIVRKTLEAKILGKWACMTFTMCYMYSNPCMLFKLMRLNSLRTAVFPFTISNNELYVLNHFWDRRAQELRKKALFRWVNTLFERTRNSIWVNIPLVSPW